jgi:formamidopyrimidine-DNA glycosylase
MPELPEVETARRQIHQALMGQRLTHVVPSPKDQIAYDRATPLQFKKAIEGARVTGSGRKGKYFWLELDRRPWPVFHLGMSGNISVKMPEDRKHLNLLSLHSNVKLSPRFCRLQLIGENGAEVWFTDPRRFGRIRLAMDPLSEPPISRLGNDPLESFLNAQELAQILKKRRAAIKAVLLDQSVFAGVGNWIADETLFQARLSPHRPASQLTLAEVKRLRTKLLAIIIQAVSVGANSERFPKSWLFHFRWGKTKDAKTASKHSIRHETIGGRTTAWVPDLQR